MQSMNKRKFSGQRDQAFRVSGENAPDIRKNVTDDKFI